MNVLIYHSSPSKQAAVHHIQGPKSFPLSLHITKQMCRDVQYLLGMKIVALSALKLRRFFLRVNVVCFQVFLTFGAYKEEADDLKKVQVGCGGYEG